MQKNNFRGDIMKVKHILSRFYVNDIDNAIAFYEKMLNVKCSSRFKYKQMNLEIASVGDILIIGGTDEALKPFKGTNATFLVDSVDEFKDFLLKNGAEVINDIKEVPTGKNVTIKHFDGTVIEYVEHKAFHS